MPSYRGYRFPPEINSHAEWLYWPVRIPKGGRGNAWHRSALDAASLAQAGWVRVAANMSLGAYEVEATAELPEPEWPDKDFQSDDRSY